LKCKFNILSILSELRIHNLGGETTLEPTIRGLTISKAIIGLSLLFPYLADWLNNEAFQQLVIYAPTWVLLQSEWSSYIGPTPMALIMFSYWLPYVYVGYQSYRFAQGKYTTTRRYIIGVVFVTLLAIVLVLPMMTVPRASDGGIDYFSMVIPLPLISIFALVLIPLLRPTELTSPWDGAQKDNSQNDDPFEQ
jgi:hypothetical protein